MKVYRSYTAKKLKLPKRILFFVICAVFILFFALLLGNHLKNKMESADIDTTPIETTPSQETEPDDIIPEGGATHDESKKSVRSGYLDISYADDEKVIRERIDKLKDDGFNAVSVVCVESGRLAYASKALEEYTRLPASENIISLDELGSAVEYAESKGMITSALFEKGSSEELDMYIASELALAGFDEIVISGFENILGEKGGEIASCTGYLTRFRTSAKGVDVSLRLSPDAFVYARNSYHIEKLFTYTEFFSVDMTEYTSEEAGELVKKIGGSFSVYMIRPFVSGDSEGVSDALKAEGVEAVQYISAIPGPDTDTAETTGKDDQ